MSNKLKEIRTRKKLSQAALGAAIGTSQQQIQRIEAGQSVRFDMALKLCQALGAQLEQVFPGTKPVLARMRANDGDLASRVCTEDTARSAMAKAGIDTDPRAWTLKLRLRGRRELCYPITRPDLERFSANLDRGDKEDVQPFFVFDSDTHAVALNLRHLDYAHMLFDAPESRPLVRDDAESQSLRVFFADGSEPLSFDVDMDEPPAETGDDNGQLRQLLASMELGVEEYGFVEFMDVDGEHAVLRGGNVALIEIPHWAISDHGDEDASSDN